MTTADAHEHDGRVMEPPASPIVWAGTLGIIAMAVLRTLVMFAPQLYFDSDPTIVSERFPGIGIAGSLLIDVITILCACLALGGLSLQSVRVRWWVVGLVCIGGVFVAMHGTGDATDLWRGSTWFAALLSAVVIAHLPGHDALRRIVLIILLASLAPLMLRGGLQMTLEHQDTLRQFEAQKDQFYASRGWDPDSPMARIYERRLMQPHPRGWFDTTNIFASLMIIALVTFGGMLIVTTRAKLQSGWAGLLGMVVAAAAAGLWLSSSRGAILVGVVCVILLLAALLLGERATALKRAAGWIAILGCLGAIGGVIVRGGVLPEGFAGELSVLFRWHYWQGAWRALMDNTFTGVGPGGFQDAYALHRPARSPEEVASAHNVFVDWFACLGMIAGIAWAATLCMLMLGLGKRERDGAQAMPIDPRAGVASVLTIAGIAGAVALFAESPALDPLLAALRLAGMLGMVALGGALVLLTQMLDESDEARDSLPLLRWALAVAAIGLLVHSQIEMTLFNPGAVLWCMCFLGVVAKISPRISRTDASSVVPGICAWLAGLVLAIALLVMAVIPAWSQQRMVASAAAMIADAANVRDVQIATRQQAAATLIDAHERWPANPRPLLHATDQLRIAADLAEREQSRVLLEEAAALAQRAMDEHASSKLAVAANLRETLYQRAAADQTEENWQAAVDAAQHVAEMDPHAITSWRRLGDVLWGARQFDPAADAYRRALENSDNFELDPFKQLSKADRAMIERRIAE